MENKELIKDDMVISTCTIRIRFDCAIYSLPFFFCNAAICCNEYGNLQSSGYKLANLKILY